jgi:hypothetical protein
MAVQFVFPAAMIGVNGPVYTLLCIVPAKSYTDNLSEVEHTMSASARSFQGTARSQRLRLERLSPEDGRGLLEELNNLVARRAYDRFDREGRIDGNDLSHWLDAEKELVVTVTGVRLAGGSFTAGLPLPGISVENIKFHATDDRAIVCAKGQSSSEPGENRQSTYYMIRWPETVDPDSCSAELENDTLTVAAHKA